MPGLRAAARRVGGLFRRPERTMSYAVTRIDTDDAGITATGELSSLIAYRRHAPRRTYRGIPLEPICWTPRTRIDGRQRQDGEDYASLGTRPRFDAPSYSRAGG